MPHRPRLCPASPLSAKVTLPSNSTAAAQRQSAPGPSGDAASAAVSIDCERRRATLTSLPAGLLLVALGLCCLAEGEETRRPFVEPFPAGLS